MSHHNVALMSNPCPSRADLDGFLAAALPLDQNAELFDHIEDCPACMAYLASQAGGPIDFNIQLDDEADEAPIPADLEKLGDYQVVRKIGQGGMGVVYECVNRVLNRPVAVKVMNPHKLSTEALARIDREAEIQSRLNHPDIATIYEFHRDPHRPYIAMELVHGQPLSHWLKGRPVPPSKAAGVLARLARAIDHAHKMGVTHRDLKPSNVLISGDWLRSAETPARESAFLGSWSLKVIDFGLSKWMSDDSHDLTQSANIVGTPSYMAPEMTRPGSKTASPCVDIYAMGVILYQCLIGRPPFVAENALQTLDLIRNIEPVAPAELLPDLPRDLNTICLKCLEKEPAKRYATALQLAEELERYLGGFPIQARPIGPVARCNRWCRRNPPLAVALASALFFLLLIIIGSLYFGFEQSRLRQLAEDSDAQSRLAVDNMMQQGVQNTNIAYFATGMLDRIGPDANGQPFSVVKYLDQADQDLQAGKIDTLEAKTTFLICLAMAYDRVGEVAKANRILISAEETISTKMPHEVSAAPYIKGYLVRAYLQQKKPEKAIQWATSALENLEKDGRIAGQLSQRLMVQLADAAVWADQPELAIPWLEKPLQLQKTDSKWANVDLSAIQSRLKALYQAAGRSDQPHGPDQTNKTTAPR